MAITAELDEAVVKLDQVTEALQNAGLAEIAARHGLAWRFAGKAEEQQETLADLKLGAVMALDILGATALLGTILGAAGIVGLAIGNLLAVLTHTRQGEEILMGSDAHMFWYEVGGAAAVGGVVMRTLPNQSDGRILLEDV